jgi:glycosyltransferase involved in cell wall biosynthesis
MHDAAVYNYPNSYSAIFRIWYKILLPVLGKVSNKIITVSEFSKSELNRFCRIPSEKMSVIYEGMDHLDRITPNESILQENGLMRESFVLAVGSNHPQKNFRAIIDLYDRMDNCDCSWDFVVVGGFSEKVFNYSEIVNDEKVKKLGYVTDSQLKALYENAACFIHPSFYEGFGLTPLEAMYCGCPCVVSNAASLPEVLGDSVLYFNPNSKEQMTSQLIKLMDDSKLRANMQKRSKEWAKRYTWNKAANGLLQVAIKW